jgi:glyoxylase-like metal-dependent hydrolase (beta-lactamase superfamily II)
VKNAAMTTIHHLNCGTLKVPNFPTVVCHCLLLKEGRHLALIDTGIGLQDAQRLDQSLIDMAGFQFNEEDTAVRRIEALGFDPGDVRHIVLTHADPDHVGGLSDFPSARIHIAAEELGSFVRGNDRYVPAQFIHEPQWVPCLRSNREWFGLESRRVGVRFSSEVRLIPLFGHTFGHCGVAIQQGDKWLLHVGDSYYLREELTTDDHPVSSIAAQRADDDGQRRTSLDHLRRLMRDHGEEVEIIGYHDIKELPSNYPIP